MSYDTSDIAYELQEKAERVMTDEALGDIEERHKILGRYLVNFFADEDVQYAMRGGEEE